MECKASKADKQAKKKARTKFNEGPMRTDPVALKMIIEYDGTDFSGCQLQPNLRTVQGELERCICRLTGEQPKLGACGGGSIVGTQGVEGGGIRVVFASRTDKGVHARGQVALVRTRSELAWTDPTSFAKRLSSFLPEDLAIVSAAHAEPEFEPRSNTKGKWYRYTIASGVSRPALGRHTHWFVPRPRESGDTSASADLLPPRPRPLDIPAMQRAASMLVGAPHDFTSFANVGKGAVSDGLDASSRDPVCLVDSITIKELMSNGDASSTSSAPCSMIDVDIRGSRFLFNMVRIIVGTLVEVGLGRLNETEIPRILASKDRQASGPGAPARGLCLMEVLY